MVCALLLEARAHSSAGTDCCCCCCCCLKTPVAVMWEWELNWRMGAADDWRVIYCLLLLLLLEGYCVLCSIDLPLCSSVAEVTVI